MAEGASKQTLGEALYERCMEDAAKSTERMKKIFTQQTLHALCDSAPLDQIRDANKLLVVVEELTKDGFFIFGKTKENRCWTLRTIDAAKHVRGMTRDERMVYSHIEEAQENGIWIRNLKAKTQIKDGKAMEKILGKLLKDKLIKNVKNIKAPMQKTYILFHLAPSDAITGGSFYDAGDVDDNMLDEMCNAIIFHVRQESWVEEKRKRPAKDSSPIVIRDEGEQVRDGSEAAPRPHKKRKGEQVMDGPEAAARGEKKRKRHSNSAFATRDIEDAAPPRKSQAHTHSHGPDSGATHEQIPFAAGHEYPDAASVYEFIARSGIMRSVKADSLTIEEVQKLLNILVWDEKLEKVNGGYRTVRGVNHKDPGHVDDADEWARKRGNGLTEMPCGQCPVVDLCGTGGLVNAESCVYFERWLDRDVVV